MRILIAPDKFKGTLSAREVGEAIATGLREILPDAKIDIAPMADGGEGTAEVISQALGASWIICTAHDPLNREVEAHYGWIEKSKSAMMEMSEVAGMRRLRPNELNPEIATTFGVGEMILDTAKRGATEIIIGLGGSATNDGGFGMARALGFRFGLEREQDGERVFDLANLKTIEKPPDLKLPQIVAAVDVRNPLLGEDGATRVFGPQKGVTPDKIGKFENALTRLADVVTAQLGCDYRSEPGAGAAGGLGFGLVSFCGAKIRPGFDEVTRAVGLERRMKDVDFVITGEGSLDRQTLEGKTPAGVAQLARKLGKRVFAFVGRATEDRQVLGMFDGVYQNSRPEMSTEENMKRAAELLQDNARQLAKDLKKRQTPNV
ncbi:MAG TPA: glycerate kinase [Chthoniobacterales bacterium]|nr:glycerate kinase [Chthoniobacterales bacterium]